ncbi:MAG TPA: ABC transporter ATP-binding protein [Streptosporangiaceae bacterium]|nr:ABC transporter ATP-binding protein [Streptosporangiaceae bacterium]
MTGQHGTSHHGVDRAVLQARGLRVELASGAAIIEDVSLDLRPGEILGLVGESGSGKTTTALSLFGYRERGVRAAQGGIEISGQPLASEQAFRGARGRLVSYVLQNPGQSLNPSLRVAAAIEDMLRAHQGQPGGQAGAAGLLDRVGLPSGPEFGRRYPHQLSGGQQQRVCIAVALASGPDVVVLDEPTTGLDVITQDRILAELLRLRDEQQVAMLYITHDLAVVSQIANRIAVMYAGRIVEQGTVDEILRRPRHPYTHGLLAATPDHLRPRALQPMPGTVAAVGARPPGCAFAPRCAQAVARCAAELPPLEQTGAGHLARCFEWRATPPLPAGPAPPVLTAAALTPAPLAPAVAPAAVVLEATGLRAEYRSRHHTVVAARDVSFRLTRGGCVALVGESGSGKTTIARVIAGLHPLAGGELRLDGAALPADARRRPRSQRRRIQIVFQNPAEALNPRHTVASAIARPARVLRGLSRAGAGAEVSRLLAAVRLPPQTARRYPGELSGGECQRVAIARALAGQPEILVCDEITSALDVSVQAVVLELLRDLRARLGISVIFITHDLGVVAAVAEQVLVLHDGAICEAGTAGQILGHPQHEYTQRLLAAAPSLSGATRPAPRT